MVWLIVIFSLLIVCMVAEVFFGKHKSIHVWLLFIGVCSLTLIGILKLFEGGF